MKMSFPKAVFPGDVNWFRKKKSLADCRGAQMKAPSERAPRGKYTGGVLEKLGQAYQNHKDDPEYQNYMRYDRGVSRGLSLGMDRSRTSCANLSFVIFITSLIG